MNENQKPTNKAYRNGWDTIWGRDAALTEMVKEAQKAGLYDFDENKGS